jgi:hypothetical protein
VQEQDQRHRTSIAAGVGGSTVDTGGGTDQFVRKLPLVPIAGMMIGNFMTARILARTAPRPSSCRPSSGLAVAPADRAIGVRTVACRRSSPPVIRGSPKAETTRV